MQTTLSGADRTRLKPHASAKPLATQPTDGTRGWSRLDGSTGLIWLSRDWSATACSIRLRTGQSKVSRSPEFRLGSGVVWEAGQEKVRCPGTSRTGRSSTEAKKDACQPLPSTLVQSLTVSRAFPPIRCSQQRLSSRFFGTQLSSRSSIESQQTLCSPSLPWSPVASSRSTRTLPAHPICRWAREPRW